jgi:hypothetical protein
MAQKRFLLWFSVKIKIQNIHKREVHDNEYFVFVILNLMLIIELIKEKPTKIVVLPTSLPSFYKKMPSKFR